MRALLLLFLLPTLLFAKTIDIQLHEVPLRKALYALAKTLDKEAIISDRIAGVTTLEIKKIKPALLLTILAQKYGFMWEEKENLLIFYTLQEWLAEQERLTETQPLQLQFFTLRYAKASTLVHVIKEDKSLLSKRGHIQADNRTNTLIMHDTPLALALVQKTIYALDKPVKQILIETHLVSLEHDSEKELGLSFQPFFPLKLSKFSQSIDVTLSLLEKQGHADILSSPRLFTADQESASIETGEEVPYQESSENGGTTTAFKKAVLGLKITPHILPGGRILLNLHLNHDRPTKTLVKDVPMITTRRITTNVILNNKETIVLGGIYEKDAEQSVTGILGLNQIPLLGRLFNKNTEKTHKRELLIFVTPIIMNH